MRKRLVQVLREQWQGRPPSHAGLAHERWAWPKPAAGAPKEQQEEWDGWLRWLEGYQEPPGYRVALERWRRALEAEPYTRHAPFQSTSRLLVGHGNPSGTEVGLALHHTWGVPVVPGSALKGLTAHYVKAVYGPEDPSHPGPERAPYGGGLWDNGRLRRGPGEVYRLLFGAPETQEPEEHASPGRILFQDALWLPGQEAGRGPLARDVLTVHQWLYYAAEKGAWPNDYDAPNPVAFLTVAPRTCFRVALGVVPGPHADELLELAWGFLQEALSQWGVGGKSSAGYGRLELCAPPAAARAAPLSPVLEELRAWLREQKELKVTQRQQLERVEGEWLPRLRALPREEHRRVLDLLRASLNSPKLQPLLAALAEKLSS